MSAHTEGPWEWVIVDHSFAFLGASVDPDLYSVMSVSPCQSCASRAKDGWKWGRCGTPNEADASLLKAAPDMLAALENLENDSGKAMPDTAWKMVQDAIAKAKGEQP